MQLWNTAKKVFIELADDGKGFEKDEVKSGIGLRNIQTRLQAFNGNMELKTAPGQGCTLMGSFQL